MKHQDFIEIAEESAFAVYSTPGQNDHWLVVGSVQRSLAHNGGFIIQQFDKGDKLPLIINPDQLLQNAHFSFQPSCLSGSDDTDKGDYLNYVDETIKAIRQGHFEKVVMSRIKIISRGSDDLCSMFLSMKERYPDAFVFMYHIPGEGAWCGATPEVLIEAKNDVIATMALAGTQRDTGLELENITWGSKERHEQNVIVEYIEKILMSEDLNFTRTGPVTTKAGNVLHLLTSFQVLNVEDPLRLSDLLHPGPAICGLPKEDAFEWIKKKEKHNREHYCGYMGPWNIKEHCCLYINLRSMRIYKNAFHLYIGGGITGDSESESEWIETELKAQTMMAVLEKSEFS